MIAYFCLFVIIHHNFFNSVFSSISIVELCCVFDLNSFSTDELHDFSSQSAEQERCVRFDRLWNCVSSLLAIVEEESIAINCKLTVW